MTDAQFVKECLSIASRAYSIQYAEAISPGRSSPDVAEARYCVYAFMREWEGWQSDRIAAALPYKMSAATVRYGYLRYYDLCEIYERSMRAMKTSWEAMKEVNDSQTENIKVI